MGRFIPAYGLATVPKSRIRSRNAAKYDEGSTADAASI